MNTETVFLAHQKIDYGALIHLNFPVALYSDNGGLPSKCKGKTLVVMPIDATKEGGEFVRAIQKALMAGSIPRAYRVLQFKGQFYGGKSYTELMPLILENEDFARTTLEALLEDPIGGGALEIQIPHEGMERMVLPKGIMSGIAGDYANLFASHLEPCREFFYFSFLVCLGTLLSGRLTLKSELQPQTRHYVLLLGDSAVDKKSTSISHTVKFFGPFDGMAACFGVGSAEGLAKRLEASPHLVLVFDEFKQFVSKCKIEGSVLLSMVTSLFENNHYENYTKTAAVKLENVHLSLLAASTISTWERTWDASFRDIGFLNRVFLVPGTGERRFSIPVEIPDLPKSELRYQIAEILKTYEYPKALTISPPGLKCFDDWYMNLETSIHAKRLDTYAHRFMPLLSVNEGKDEVDLPIVEKAIAIMDWQLAVRQQLDPIDADGTIAQTEERIRRALSRGPKSEHEIKRVINYTRLGLWAYMQAMRNLSQAHEIDYDKQMGLYGLASNLASGAQNGGRL